MLFKSCLVFLISSMGLYSFVSAKTSPAPAQESQSPSVSPASSMPDSLPLTDPKILRGTLPNGLKYIIRPNAQPQNRVSLRMFVNVGSLCETDAESGISHFIEHMVFGGSKNFPKRDLIQTLQRHGLMFGRDVNAYTSFEETVYMLDLPNIEDKTLGLTLSVMRDFADGALFEESSLDKERGIIHNELKTRDSADYRILKQSFNFLLDGTHIVSRLPIGTEEMILKTPRKTFVDYYSKHYAADQITFIMVGDIDPKKAQKLIEDTFSSMKPSGCQNEPKRGSLIPKKERQAKVIVEKEIPTARLSLYNITPFTPEEDTVANRVKDLPLRLAASMLNRRFEILSKQADCPFLGVSTQTGDMLNVARLVGLDAQAEPSKWKPTLELMEQELRRATEFGFTPAEYKEATQKLLQQLDQAVETWETKHSDDIASDIASTIGEDKVFTAPEEDRRIWQEALKNIRVEDCHAALKKQWDVNKAQILITGTVDIPEGEKAVLEAFERSLAVPVLAPKMTEEQEFAYLDLGPAGKVAKKEVIEDLGLVQLTLSNGVRVNYKKTDFEKNTINLQVRVSGGSALQPKSKAGFTDYVGYILNAGGLEAHSNDELEQLLAGKQVGTHFNVSENAFTLSGLTNPKDLELELKLLCANIMHPGYREEAEIPFKRSIPLVYERMERDSEGVYQMKANELLLPQDSRFAHPTKEQILGYSLAEVKDWVDKPLKENALEINIVGDFEPKQLEAYLLSTFGALPKRATEASTPKPEDLKVSFAPMGAHHFLTYPTQLDKALTTVSWKTPDGKDKKRATRLQLLSSIANNRILEEIREKMGDAYSPRGSLTLSDTFTDYGLFSAKSPGTPENSERVALALVELGEKLTEAPISSDELQRVRLPLIASLKKAERTNGYWLQNALSETQFKPEKIEQLRHYIKDMESITAEELQELAKTIFKKENATIIRVVPEKTPDNTPEKDDSKANVSPAPASSTKAQDLSAKAHFITPEEGEFAVLISQKTAKKPEWKAVADSLTQAYKGKAFF